MAELTRTQIKKRLKELWDKGELGELESAIDTAIETIDDVINDVENERDNIEPYEGKDDLTDKQQERYDWLDNLLDDLNSLKDDLESWQGDMGSHYDELYERE